MTGRERGRVAERRVRDSGRSCTIAIRNRLARGRAGLRRVGGRAGRGATGGSHARTTGERRVRVRLMQVVIGVRVRVPGLRKRGRDGVRWRNGSRLLRGTGGAASRVGARGGRLRTRCGGGARARVRLRVCDGSGRMKSRLCGVSESGGVRREMRRRAGIRERRRLSRLESRRRMAVRVERIGGEAFGRRRSRVVAWVGRVRHGRRRHGRSTSTRRCRPALAGRCRRARRALAGVERDTAARRVGGARAAARRRVRLMRVRVRWVWVGVRIRVSGRIGHAVRRHGARRRHDLARLAPIIRERRVRKRLGPPIGHVRVFVRARTARRALPAVTRARHALTPLL